ncbi:MAG: polysaccharide pyruvyl transferase family protein [Pseudomonadales bacterium]
MKPLKLFWARGTGKGAGARNAGDWYSPLICAHLSGREVEYAAPHRCDLVAAGSLLQRLNRPHRLHRLGLSRRLHIWGTGSLRAEDSLTAQHSVHAVRGVLTRERMAAADPSVPLGDPGLLADTLVEANGAKRWPLGIVPHLVDRDHPEVLAFLDRHPRAKLLDVTAPVPELLGNVAACERVLSSSLHGLIFADAYGVPNAWFAASDRLIGGRHKFDDYYSVFAMRPDPMRLDAVNPDEIGTDYARPGIDAIKAALASAFPRL